MTDNRLCPSSISISIFSSFILGRNFQELSLSAVSYHSWSEPCCLLTWTPLMLFQLKPSRLFKPLLHHHEVWLKLPHLCLPVRNNKCWDSVIVSVMVKVKSRVHILPSVELLTSGSAQSPLCISIWCSSDSQGHFWTDRASLQLSSSKAFWNFTIKI